MTFRCPAPLVKCTMCPLQHYTCSAHDFHNGDLVQDTSTGWTGYIFDANNPHLGERSMYVIWDEPKVENGRTFPGKLFAGFAPCQYLVKLGGKTDQKTATR